MLKKELSDFIAIVKSLDKRVTTILLAVAVLQTVSWYVTSRRFFRTNFFPSFQSDPNVYLIEYLYWFIGDFVVFFIIPAIIIVYFFKDKLNEYGITFGDYKTGFKLTVLFIVVMVPLIWFASADSSFAATYPHLHSARDSWLIFFIFESGMFIYMFGWEFIWRGFMLFGLEKKFGYYAVLIQMIPFVILHNGKPAPETFAAILGGIALGVLALRTRSVFYCVIVHMSVMFSIDFISTLRYKAGDYGLGINSFINLLKQIF